MQSHILSIILFTPLVGAFVLLLVPTVLSGFCYLPVGSLVRARWSYLLADSPQLGAAYCESARAICSGRRLELSLRGTSPRTSKKGL